MMVPRLISAGVRAVRGGVSSIGRDAGCSLVNQACVSGFNFAVGIIAARILGVADFGLFSLVLMVAMLLSGLQDHYLTAPMMTVAGSRARCSAAYFNAVRHIGLALSLACAAIMAGFVVANGSLRGTEVDIGFIAACAFLTFAQNQQLVLRRTLFAENLRVHAVVLDLSRCLITVAMAAAAALVGVAGDATAILVILGGSAFLASLPFSGYVAHLSLRRRLYSAVIARQWPMARWLGVVFLVSVGHDHAVWIITGIALGDEALGGLRAGLYLLGAVQLVVLALENFMPRHAAQHLRIGGHGALGSYLLRQLVVFGVPIGAGLAVIAVFDKPLISFVFGEQYAPYSHFAIVFAVLYGVSFVRRIGEYYLRAYETTRPIFRAYCAASLTALVVIYPMIEAFGATGAALTMLAGETVCLGFIAASVARMASGPVHFAGTRAGSRFAHARS